MRQFIGITLSLLLISLTGCKKPGPVTACIELSNSSINAGESITFTSCSENEWSYIWEISGPVGAIENEKGWSDRLFTNQFDSTGTYWVKLTTFDDFSFLGNSAADSVQFTVN